MHAPGEVAFRWGNLETLYASTDQISHINFSQERSGGSVFRCRQKWLGNTAKFHATYTRNDTESVWNVQQGFICREQRIANVATGAKTNLNAKDITARQKRVPENIKSKE